MLGPFVVTLRMSEVANEWPKKLMCYKNKEGCFWAHVSPDGAICLDEDFVARFAQEKPAPMMRREQEEKIVKVISEKYVPRIVQSVIDQMKT